MARIRSIHPGFARSADIAALSIPCQLHFALLWTYADDHGKGKDDVRLIKAECWPLQDGMTVKKVEAMQAELARMGRIIRYVVDGKRYFQVVNWSKYQHPQKARDSEYPDPPSPVVLPEASRTPPVVLPSVVGEGEGEGEGEEREREAPPASVPPDAPPPTATGKAHRLPADFVVSDEMREWAQREAPTVPLDTELAKFRDYWAGVGGERGRKTDWPATWRNWMRKAAEDRPARHTNGQAPRSRFEESWARVEAEEARR